MNRNHGFHRALDHVYDVFVDQLEVPLAVMRMLVEPADLAELAGASTFRLDRRLLVIAALLVATVGLGLAIWGWASRAPSADDMPKIVYRRDAVRALADEQARSPGAPQSAVGGSESVGSPGDQHPY